MNKVQVWNGRVFDYDNIDKTDFNINDIAHSLSLKCRFGGHCKWFYSVGQHLINCYKVAQTLGLPIALQTAALLHDATEAYFDDMVKPLKRKLKDYQLIEKEAEKAFTFQHRVDWNPDLGWGEIIKEIDARMLITERNALFDLYNEALWPNVEPYELIKIEKEVPETVENNFLKIYHRLRG